MRDFFHLTNWNRSGDFWQQSNPLGAQAPSNAFERDCES